MDRPVTSARIEEIVERASSSSEQSDNVTYTGFSAFIRSLFGDAHPDEIEAYDSDQLFHLALSFWRFSAERKSNAHIIRVFNPTLEEDGWHSPNTVLEIVLSNMPFVVESILAELTAQDLELHSVMHPIVTVSRDEAGNRLELVDGGEELGGSALQESLIHIEFDYHSDQRRLESIRKRIEVILSEVQVVVTDFEPMKERLNEAIRGLDETCASLDPDELEESKAFLNWMRDDHFALLGSRIYRFDGEPETGTLVPLDETGLGLLRDPDARMLRRGSELVYFTSEVREFLMLPSPIIITKANVRSEIHRRVYMDYIGVKLFDTQGQLTGEYRFLGLFTAEAYNRSTARIPLLSRKVERVIERCGFASASFNKKALKNILETYPRDELFQTSEDELIRICLGILDLQERPRTKLFTRHDRYDRYVSCLVYVPRERFDSRTRQKIADILVKAYNGRLSAFYPYFNDSPLARVHYIIGRDSGEGAERPDEREVERAIIEVTRNFKDALSNELRPIYGDENARPLVVRYSEAFSAGYQEANTAQDALYDIERLEPLGGYPAISLRSYRREGDAPSSMRLKLYRADQPVPLSDALPILENLGLKVMEEAGYQVNRGDAVFWIHDFYTEHPKGLELDFNQVAGNLEDAFAAIWYGHAENDPFNRLCVEQGIHWRHVSLLRGFAHFWRQTGRTLSVSYMQDTLANHPSITGLLIDLFDTRFDPATELSKVVRDQFAVEIKDQIIQALDEVQSLDEDRIIRQFLDLIMAMWRTNFYQRNVAGEDKSYISFKISSRMLDDLPLPKPLTEMFVYSPRVEGVHLRWGFVARGGLRWSDRREDFRTEVLGLAKAQQVKNAVIVPVGAKGGFVPKHLPEGGSREEIQQEGITCYRIFISGLLDIADNIVDGKVVKPEGVVVHDNDDPYLVVAADKGTATFSDIANEISQAYGFWLGDAFASGGSQGYDHKGMGITAKGAWEAVKRHFREMGKDIQSEPFTAIGVGDMSGDVFGNGMLLSEQTRLVAAFDHRDIFLDPNPDEKASFEERKRMFELPRSSWADYNKDLISEGGGVHSRSLKSIPITDQVKNVLGISEDKLTPHELMQAILKSPIELLWFGGIGTYVKSSDQRDNEVGDKANDPIRVDANELQVKVVGEGANLGITQAGRIEYARAGGRVNTDAIDNAAGVDCSDHEVNIKILVDRAVAEGRMSEDERNALLETMTDDVSRLVLSNNYEQTLALTLAQTKPESHLESDRRFMHALERRDLLNRKVEGLPSDEQLDELHANGQGLSRPELAVVMAYSKLTLFDDLIISDVPDIPVLTEQLHKYVPDVLVERFEDLIDQHQLRREIIATVLSSQIVNVAGSTFVNRMVENNGHNVALVARAFVATQEAFKLELLRREIHALDNKVSTKVQISLYRAIRDFFNRQVPWFLRNSITEVGDQVTLPVRDVIETYQNGVVEVVSCLTDSLSPLLVETLRQRTDEMTRAGVEEELAISITLLEPLGSACDIIDIASAVDADIALVTKLYFIIGDQLGLDRLREQASNLKLVEYWERLAVSRTIDDLLHQKRLLTELIILGSEDRSSAEAMIDQWYGQYAQSAERAKNMILEMEAGGALSVAKLSLAASQVRELTALVSSRLSIHSDS